MPASLGTAYVQIVPQAKGIAGAISQQLGGEAETAGTSIGGKIGAFAKKAIITAGIGTLVVKGLKDSIAQGAALEQNMGGAVAVFGKGLYGALEKNATTAYKNMGLSASDYYATANKMGSLFQGSGISQQKSLELTTNAMQRAADVASVMGIDMSMAMESVAGAAKGNFTMMDNLGVAMNATTLEAYALEKGLNFKWNTASNAEKAELAMQMFMDRTSQYAGNFARESEDTFSGSLDSMKAAYQNFLGSLSLGEGVSKSMSALAKTVSTFLFKNLIPMIGRVIKSLPPAIGVFLQQGVPMILSGLSTMISTLSLQITAAAKTVTSAKVKEWVTTTLPKLVSAAAQMIGRFAATLIVHLPKIVAAIGRIGAEIVKGLGSAIWGKVTQAANGIKERFLAPINSLKDKVSNLVAKIKKIFPVSLGNICNFSLPKISVSGGTAPWGIGGKGTKPSFSLSWEKHALGGIFTRPTFLTAGNVIHEFGEKGHEALVPLDPFWKRLADFKQAILENPRSVVINVYESGDPRRTAQEVKKILINDTKRENAAWR